MSWDLFAMKFPRSFTVLDDIPLDYDPEPAGSRADLIAALRERLPGSELNQWGSLIVEGPGYAMDIDVGSPDDDIVKMVVFRVWGSGEAVVDVVADSLDLLGLRAVETGSGGFFDRDTGLAGFRGWKQHRDAVMPRPTQQGPGPAPPA